MSDFEDVPTVVIPKQTMRELVMGENQTPWWAREDYQAAERDERKAQFECDVLAQQIASSVSYGVQPPREVVEAYKRWRARREDAQRRITAAMDAAGVERAS